MDIPEYWNYEDELYDYYEKYNIDYHIKAFNKLCMLLNNYVKHIIISFIDEYKNVKLNYKYLSEG